MEKVNAKNYLSAKYMAALAVALVLAVFIGTQIGNGDTTAEELVAPETVVEEEAPAAEESTEAPATEEPTEEKGEDA